MQRNSVLLRIFYFCLNFNGVELVQAAGFHNLINSFE